jgi:hypothetical protein
MFFGRIVTLKNYFNNMLTNLQTLSQIYSSRFSPIVIFEKTIERICLPMICMYVKS